MHAQSTASRPEGTRTVVAKSGTILPATITPETDFNTIATAMAVYYKQSGCLGSFDTASLVADAMRDSGAVVVLYVGLDGGHGCSLGGARVLWPNSVTFTKDRKIVCKAYCTMRREWRTFRIDRMLTCHPLSTPDDVIEEEEEQEMHQDFEDSPRGREIAAR